jgi:hypothetical protein
VKAIHLAWRAAVLVVLCTLTWLAYGIRQELGALNDNGFEVSAALKTICNHGESYGPCR